MDIILALAWFFPVFQFLKKQMLTGDFFFFKGKVLFKGSTLTWQLRKHFVLRSQSDVTEYFQNISVLMHIQGSTMLPSVSSLFANSNMPNSFADKALLMYHF